MKIWALILIVQAPLLLSLADGAHAGDSPATLNSYQAQPRNAGDDLHPYFYVDKEGIWPSHNVEVCWEASAAPYAKQQSWVRAAIAKFIERKSAFRFGAHWPQCDADLRARIRIIVVDSASESEVGYQKNGLQVGPTHMLINFTFKNWYQDCARSEARRERCITTIAVHEFLHAVGTLHEQLNPDIRTHDPVCWAKYKDIPDVFGKAPVALTDYDPDSIMNYCKNIYDVPTHLSALDSVGLKKLSDDTGAPQSQ